MWNNAIKNSFRVLLCTEYSVQYSIVLCHNCFFTGGLCPVVLSFHLIHTLQSSSAEQACSCIGNALNRNDLITPIRLLRHGPMLISCELSFIIDGILHHERKCKEEEYCGCGPENYIPHKYMYSVRNTVILELIEKGGG